MLVVLVSSRVFVFREKANKVKEGVLDKNHLHVLFAF